MDNKPTVLIVDDDIDIANETSVVLNRTGSFNVIVANNGDDGINTIKKGDIDVTLLDVRMPGKSGIDTLKEIIAFDRDAYVIMLTAFDESDVAFEAAKLGAKDFLTKPYDQKDLILRVTMSTGNREKRNEEIKKWKLLEQLREFSHIRPELVAEVWDDLFKSQHMHNYETITDLPYETIKSIVSRMFVNN